MNYKIRFVFLSVTSFLVFESDVVLSTEIVIPKFDENDKNLEAFKTMCENIKSVLDGRKSIFISYAWPEKPEDDPLRDWINNIFHYLCLSGLDVVYDITHFTGRVSDLYARLNDAKKVLVLLTPGYRRKCEAGTAINDEVMAVFSQGFYRRRFVLLKGTEELGIPFAYVKGHYTYGAEMIHMMTGANYHNQKESDVPSMDAFFQVMCNLLDPTKEWGLLFEIALHKKEVISNMIDSFLEKIGKKPREKIGYYYEQSGVIPFYVQITNLRNTSVNYASQVFSAPYFESRTDNEGVDYIEKIDKAFTYDIKGVTTGHRYVNLFGTGGIGKTTLAREYALRSATKYDIIWVFNSERKEFLEVSFKELYKKLFANHTVDDFFSMRERITDYIAKCQIKCLFIYDNIEEEALFYKLEISEPSVHVILTSRQKIDNGCFAYEDLSNFKEDEAINCIKKISERRFPETDVEQNLKQIVEFVGYLPLAVAHVGYYLKQIKMTTLSNYLEELRKQTTLLQKVVKNFPVTVFHVFKRSYEDLSEDAQTLLFVLGFLDVDDIPLATLTEFIQNNESYLLLEKYGFLKLRGEGDFVFGSIHRLHQKIIQCACEQKEIGMFETVDFSMIYRLLFQSWEGFSLSYQGSDDFKEDSYRLFSCILKNWKIFNCFSAQKGFPEQDYSKIQLQKISYLSDMLNLENVDRLIQEELGLTETEGCEIREKIKDFSNFIKSKDIDFNELFLYEVVQKFPKLQKCHFDFVKKLMEQVNSSGIKRLDLEKCLEVLSEKAEEDLSIFYGDLLETMNEKFENLGLAFYITVYVPKEDRCFFYENLLKTIEYRESNMIHDVEYMHLKQLFLSERERERDIAKIFLHFPRTTYFDIKDLFQEMDDTFIQVAKEALAIYLQEINPKYRDYHKIYSLFSLMLEYNFDRNLPLDIRNQKWVLLVRRYSQFLDLMEQNGVCLKDEDNDLSSDAQCFVDASEDDWNLVMDMLQNLLSKERVGSVWSVNSLCVALIGLDWQKKFLLCELINIVGIDNVSTFQFFFDIFQKEDIDSLDLSVKRLNNILKNNTIFGDYHYLLQNILSIQQCDDSNCTDFLFFETELFPFFAQSFLNHILKDDKKDFIRKIKTLKEKNPEKWYWIKTFLIKNRMEDNLIGVFDKLCRIQYTKKVDDCFPFFRKFYLFSMIHCANLILEQLDNDDIINYVVMYDKNQVVFQLIGDENILPQTIVNINRLIEKQIEWLVYILERDIFEKKYFDSSQDKLINFASSLTEETWTCFKAVVDHLSMFKKAFSGISIESLAKMSIKEWASVVSELKERPKTDSLEDVFRFITNSPF